MNFKGIKRKIKQAFCKHDWVFTEEIVEGVLLPTAYYKTTTKTCSKCGEWWTVQFDKIE